MRCALCGYEFDEKGLACHSGCPLGDHCAIICCPNCGYQVVDHAKSRSVALLDRLLASLTRKPAPPTRKPAPTREEQP